MSSECGCKEVYRFPHITYYLHFFCSSIPIFVLFFKMFFFLVYRASILSSTSDEV